MKTKPAIKAGKLANGFERGKGKVVHAVELSPLEYGGHAVCGEKPAIAWSEREGEAVTCARCLKQLRLEAMVSDCLDQVDEMIRGSK